MSEDRARPHPARMYDYFLGGKDNFAVDRLAAQRALDEQPQVAVIARESWDVLDPGVVYVHEWRPDGDEQACEMGLCGVARKPA